MQLSKAFIALINFAALVVSAPIETSETAASSANLDSTSPPVDSHAEFDPELNWCHAHKTMTYLHFRVAGQQWNGVNVTQDNFLETVNHCGLVTEFQWFPDEKNTGNFHARFRTPIRKKKCVTDRLQEDLGAPSMVHCTGHYHE